MKKRSKSQKDSMGAAIYARSATNDVASIKRQIRATRRAARRMGLSVQSQHIYIDSGVSGNELGRAGLNALLGAAKAIPSPFRRVLVEDGSRVSRNLADAQNFIQQLHHHGVTLYLVHPGCDSQDQRFMGTFALSITLDQYLREAARARRLEKKRPRPASDTPFTRNLMAAFNEYFADARKGRKAKK